ncbi:putative aspartic peptidase A1 [Melampsora larici-populina 98AG31]|uniref:Putative aspartic peptidase A1 n=1 Tax=Melampsora larici-populina (strain 98AG31 / pathotype 3-4-7) TaxID=747676 RepID=F4RG96_MELLP|nr:putative aspartic peptidase A1 [Melampsora larici-populina 98AG31]EGG08706.1 putative aspartic peptidase A1 [Melampsora larici-populina 98AG31]
MLNHQPFIILFRTILLINQLIIPTSTSNLEFQLYKRSTSQNRFIHAKSKLINKYSSTTSTTSLQKRQISVPIISNLSNPSSSSTTTTNTGTYLHNSTVRGVSDGRGGVIGLQPTYNFQADLEYFITIQIGTDSPQSLNIILDTGSSDFWVTSQNCTLQSGCDSNLLSKFDSSLSNSTNTPFSIKYGSGSATGKSFIDNITFAGYHLTNQQFGVVDTVSSELLSKDVSGLMGLGFQTLSSSGIKPLWQSLLSNPTQYNLSFPGFSFALTRFINQTNASEIEPGGLFTIGTLNTSLLEGEIEFIPLPIGLESYWLIPMESISVNGFSLDLSKQRTKNVAIDTGTTLIGGPADEVAGFYKQIPGALPATGSYQGYYSYPCNSSVNLNFKFGTRNYSMTSQDFNLGPFPGNPTTTTTNTSSSSSSSSSGGGSAGNPSMCLGAVFELTLAGASKDLISWVIGDSFLKK